MFSLAIASRKYDSRHFRTSGTTLEQNPILRISLPVLLVPKSLSTTLCGGMGHLRQPIHSVFVFIKSLLSAKDFLRNCLHTSKSWGALHSGQRVASDFFSFLLWVLLLATSWESVAKVLNLGGFLKLKVGGQNVKERNEGMPTCKPVDVQDLQRAELQILKIVQNEAFQNEIKMLKDTKIKFQATDKDARKERMKTMKRSISLYKLDPFIDKNGVLRVGGRLRQFSVPCEVKHPVSLPWKGHVTNLILCLYHQLVQHQGRKRITQNEIRSSGYWIIGGSSAVSDHISKRVSCRKLRGRPQEQKIANLPEDPLEPALSFTFCAVDYFGPWYVKEGHREMKRYGVLSTCLAFRTVHLEVASSLSNDSFLNAYRRFVGRRGPVRQLQSDQGTNFVGAKIELQQALFLFQHEKIQQELAKRNCD